MLIVEDDRATREMLARGLTEEHCDVATAPDGLIAEDLTMVRAFDVILLDLMLPGTDGLMLCRRLRARGVDTPVLVLSARQTPADRVRALNAGADDYVCKPFAFEEVLARLRVLSRRGRTRVLTAALRCGPIELSQLDRVATVNGHVLELTATEFRLLEYFMRRPGAVVTSEELAEHVWGRAVDRSNVIDVYVGYLRTKLRAVHQPLLQTVRRRGYALRLPRQEECRESS